MSDPRLAGSPIPFELGGKSLMLPGRVTFRQRATFANWVQQEAFRGLARHRELMGEEAFRLSLEGWRHDLASHVYDWGGPACHKVLFTDAGLVHLTWLLFESGKAEGGSPTSEAAIDRLREEDPTRWKELTDLVLGVLFPNVQAPAAEPASQPDEV